MMNQWDISGILMTYSEKVAKSKTTKQLKKVIKDLRAELDLRKIKIENGGE